MTPYINDLLDGRTLLGVFPDRAAETLIGTYAAGHLVRISRQITKQKPDIEQIVGPDEVWAICPRKPVPGWRLLGRWHAQDVFIALRPWDKSALVGKYPMASQEVITDWQSLFGAEQPHRGNDLGDYLSGVFIDVDQRP